MGFNVPTSISFLLLLMACIAQAHEYNEKGWGRASEFLKSSMDYRHHPCRHFFGYACGAATGGQSPIIHKTPDLEAELRKRLNQALRRTGRPMHQVSEPDYKTWVRTLRDQCMRLEIMTDRELFSNTLKALTKTLDLEVLHEEENETNATSTAASDSWHMVGYMKRMFMCPVLMDASVDWTVVNCTKKSILKLSYSFGPDLKINQEQLTQIFVNFLGENDSFVENDTMAVLALFFEDYQAKLVKLVDDEYERNTRTAGAEEGRVMKLSEIVNKYPIVDWHAYLDGLFGKERAEQWKRSDPEILLVGDQYFTELGPFVNKDGFETHILDLYVYWKLVDKIKSFYSSKTSGMSRTTTPEEMDKFCYKILKEFAPAAVGRLIFDELKANITEWRNDVDLVGANVLAAFRIFITGQDWLDSQGKMAIIRRIDDIRVDTGIPMWLEDDKEVNKRTPKMEKHLSTIENIANALQITFQEAFRPLLNTESGFIEPPPRLKLGAKYESGKIQLNLGQLFPPLYDIDYPLAVKYGTLGWLIGHQLMQGFDEANLRQMLITQQGSDWLSGDRDRKFQQRKACIVRQYSSYCYRDAQGKCVRIGGSKTINENVGDIEGVKIAYMAYKFVTQTMGPEPPLPEFVRLSNDELFFISAAQLHCRGEQFERYMTSGGKGFLRRRTPNNHRVEQAMRNFPVFAKTFQCVKGSKYAPFRTCSLWGRFVSPV